MVWTKINIFDLVRAVSGKTIGYANWFVQIYEAHNNRNCEGI